MAIANAASFLQLQFKNPRFKSAVNHLHSIKSLDRQPQFPLIASTKKDATTLIAECAENIKDHLRKLAPEFKLLEKGYKLPVPRMRNAQYTNGLDTKFSSDPEEIRDALEKCNAILLSIPKNYPDDSLPWVIASDLLTAVIDGRQVLPVVIDGGAVKPPHIGIKKAAYWDYSVAEDLEGVRLIFIIVEPSLGSKTRREFLIDQIKMHPLSQFIIISRSETDIINESELSAQINANHYYLSNVSFNEIAHFVQKNFDMQDAEAEVIALRLNDTFNSFDLSAHPTYFVGISRELLSPLLQANRRAELIQLAVDGFLSLVVAADTAAVKLTRTTRSRFLQMIVKEIKLHRRSFSRGDAVKMASDLSNKYDYGINPSDFVQSFVDSGIINFADDVLSFSLPFVESYLLAIELTESTEEALSYFDLEDGDIDLGTFDIYCEIKPAPEVIEKIMRYVEGSRNALALPKAKKHILLTDAARPELLARADRLRQIEERFHKLTDDVHAGRGNVKHKQKMLDIADRLREAASIEIRLSNEDEDEEEFFAESFKKFGDHIKYWTTGAQMLGSAAEHLHADTKEKLAGILIDMVSLLAHAWIEFYKKVDFDKIRKEFTSDNKIKSLLKDSEEKTELTEFRRQVEGMVDLLEFNILAAPFLRFLHILCERAGLRVLATSVEKAMHSGEVEKLTHALWLADIDGKRGHDALMRAMKDLPPSPFLRIIIANHLMSRVYWNQSEKSDRLRFLDAAEIALRPIVKLRKGEIMREIRASKPT